MPTAAKFAAALCLAFVLYIATINYIPALPEGTQTKGIAEIAAGIGCLCGWLFVGPKPGRTSGKAISNGIKGALIAVFWVLMVAATYQMIRRSLRMMYDGAFEAVIGIFEQVLDLGGYVFVPGVLAWIFMGGLATGLITRAVSLRWK
jgi:hypothetical protein